MIALVILVVILLIISLIMILRVGVTVKYIEGEFTLKVIAGPVKLTLFPAPEKKPKPKEPKKEKKPKEKKKPAEEKPESEKPKQSIPELIDRFVPPVLEALGRFKSKLLINNLTFYYSIAGINDPYSAALNYGRISAAMASLIPLLENTLNIRKRSIGVNISFETDENKIYVDVTLTIAIWQIIYVALAVLPALVPGSKNNKSDGKEEKNGQAANE